MKQTIKMSCLLALLASTVACASIPSVKSANPFAGGSAYAPAIVSGNSVGALSSGELHLQ